MSAAIDVLLLTGMIAGIIVNEGWRSLWIDLVGAGLLLALLVIASPPLERWADSRWRSTGKDRGRAALNLTATEDQAPRD